MAFYPAWLDLRDRLALLVGGGQVAGRKLASLLEAGARVRLVAPRLAPETSARLPHPRVEHHPRAFAASDLAGVWLAICATDDQTVNRAVATACEAARIFVNVVDVPDLCGFIVPASFRRGELTVAVSTGGAGPAVARRLRERLEADFGPEWGPYLALMRAARDWVKAQGRPAAANRPVFFALADAGLLELIARRDWAALEARLAAILGPGADLTALGLTRADLTPNAEATS